MINVNRLFRYFNKPARKQAESLVYHLRLAKDILFERRHGFEFDGCVAASDLVATNPLSLASASPYEPVSSVALQDLITEALELGGPFDNFVDVGCGKGKACIYAARRFAFAHVHGVDFSHPLIDVAQQNLRRAGLRNVTFACADAADWRLPPGRNLVFLYNPFDASLLRRFLTNNLASFSQDDSVVAYINDVQRSVLRELGFEVVYRIHRTVHSLHVMPRKPESLP